VAKDIAIKIPNNYRAGDNTWLGLSARARVLVMNTRAKGLGFVNSVFDLADPRLKGKLAITHSANGSYIAGVTVYMEKAGKEETAQWLKGMKANVGDQVFNKHSKIVKAVASGKKSVGLVNHYYIYRHLAKHPNAPVKIVLPDQGKRDMGVAWNVAGAAITKHSKNKQAAEKLMRFFVSKKGQKMFAEVNREYPTRAGIKAHKAVPAAGSYKIADVPMEVLGEQRNATLDLIESVGMP
jgi:iron(III) transport system substrate-binding protein